MAKATFNVTAESAGMRSDIKAGKHTIIIDEPASMGGKDTGADPLSTMLASLAGCENVIANFVAKEIGFDLQGMSFTITGELDTRGLMGEEGVRPYFEKISIQALVKTTESNERIQELKEMTDKRCPVYTGFKAAGVELLTEWKKA
ncbi:OsmC family protein [Bacillus sp. CHD6a]|uniref:OsmC family protein n=1 Tax=Bacillus sp. CHD6a TaxID=1643452 RepID=UPI0006CC557E|nr:OsmC family protein [Bacillus sp. CHD6a]KPB03247.1 osmotically inducible protein C [Bacillus sp. CHD6a]